jgi:hypothetical protein
MSIVVRSVPRRAALAAAMLVLVAIAGVLTAGGAVARTSACGGTQGQPVLLGCGFNTSVATTVITVPGDNLSGLWVSETGQGSWGIRADGADRGVAASGLVGVRGEGADGGIGVLGVSPDLGVKGAGYIGVTGDGTFAGVTGTSNGGDGDGVRGVSINGAGLVGESVPDQSGVGLKVMGRSVFRTGGTAVVASGQKKVIVSLAGVSPTDFVLATVQGSGAFYVKNATAGTGQFTVAINKAPTAPATVTVAYFVISAS